MKYAVQDLHGELTHEPPYIEWPARQHSRHRVTSVVQYEFKPVGSFELVLYCVGRNGQLRFYTPPHPLRAEERR